MSDCIFCRILSGEIPAKRVYEDEEFLAFLDNGPVSHGHTLVIPKIHYDRFETTPEDVVGRMYQLVRRLSPAIARAVGTGDFNLGLNNGPSAGQAVFHTHVHIMPRRPNDGLESWAKVEYQGNEMDEVAKKVRAAIKGDI